MLCTLVPKSFNNPSPVTGSSSSSSRETSGDVNFQSISILLNNLFGIVHISCSIRINVLQSAFRKPQKSFLLCRNITGSVLVQLYNCSFVLCLVVVNSMDNFMISGRL